VNVSALLSKPLLLERDETTWHLPKRGCSSRQSSRMMMLCSKAGARSDRMWSRSLSAAVGP